MAGFLEVQTTEVPWWYGRPTCLNGEFCEKCLYPLIKALRPHPDRPVAQNGTTCDFGCPSHMRRILYVRGHTGYCPPVSQCLRALPSCCATCLDILRLKC